MQNQVDIDHKHCREIILEIGERLRAYLGKESDLPASLAGQIDRLREVENRSASDGRQNA
jgi:hypothetical protein